MKKKEKKHPHLEKKHKDHGLMKAPHKEKSMHEKEGMKNPTAHKGK